LPEDDKNGSAMGGWLDVIKAIPGAANAIARLIGRAGEAGAAWLDVATAKGEQRASVIRGDTAAIESIRKLLVERAANQAANDPTFVDRALNRWASDLTTKQVNREAVAKLAIEDLTEESPEPSTPGPSDDWMNVFETYAERATSDTLRQHWARILAGEIRRPGSFSLLTLQLMSVLDHGLAEIVQQACPWVALSKYIPVVGQLNQGLL
jgi:hypothetical protein